MNDFSNKEPESARLYSENRHINGRTILDPPISSLDVRERHNADTYLNHLPGKCEITKYDRDLLQSVKEEE